MDPNLHAVCDTRGKPLDLFITLPGWMEIHRRGGVAQPSIYGRLASRDVATEAPKTKAKMVTVLTAVPRPSSRLLLSIVSDPDLRLKPLIAGVVDLRCVKLWYATGYLTPGRTVDRRSADVAGE